MFSSRKIEEIIGSLLLYGTVFSAVIVFIGGMLYLWQFGDVSLQTQLLNGNKYNIVIRHIWAMTDNFSSLSIIELGLIALVVTQILRVGVLVLFYYVKRDYYFTAICTFIFLVLLYSFLLQK